MDIQMKRLTANCVVEEVHPLYIFLKKSLIDFNIAFGISYLDGSICQLN
jgi:hypothetical protein